MAKLKKKNKVAKASAPSNDEDDAAKDATLANSIPTDRVEVESEDVNFAGDGDDYYHVIKGDHSAIVRGNSKADAKEAFFKLYGILDTNEVVRVGKIDEDDLSSFKLNVFGVILGTA